MATVNLSRPDRAPRTQHRPWVGRAFILDADESYPAGINAYLFGRDRGLIDLTALDNPKTYAYPLAMKTLRQVAANLADLLTWGETTDAHPSMGQLDWKSIKLWHITDLYRDAMNLGFWTENFWATGSPISLSPRTVSVRVREALSCYQWMATSGYIFDVANAPQRADIEHARVQIIAGYRGLASATPVGDTPPPRVRQVRRTPGDMPLPTLEHLIGYFEAMPTRSARLAHMVLFETGMRAAELVDNMLLPGRWHLHRPSGASPRGSLFGTDRYLLRHDLLDNRMIGVIPTFESADIEFAQSGTLPRYRIIGKNDRIRLVRLSLELLAAIWRQVKAGKNTVDPAQPDLQTPFALRNSHGGQMQYWTLWEASDEANKRLSGPFRITAHALRHAYACYRLRSAVRAAAGRAGYNPDATSLSFRLELAESILPSLQIELGHALLSTTTRYLQQYMNSDIANANSRQWNYFLDSALDHDT